MFTYVKIVQSKHSIEFNFLDQIKNYNYKKHKFLKEAIDAYDNLSPADQLEYLMFNPLGFWAFTSTLYQHPGTPYRLLFLQFINYLSFFSNV